MSKYGVISGPYFPAFGLNMERYFVFSRIRTEYGEISVFSPNAGKYGPEITSCLDTFHVVLVIRLANRIKYYNFWFSQETRLS